MLPMIGPSKPTFPAIHRQFIYFLSSAAARSEFMMNPLAFLCQPTPKPAVPIRIAIVGPPKSGKSTRMLFYYFLFCTQSNIQLNLIVVCVCRTSITEYLLIQDRD